MHFTMTAVSCSFFLVGAFSAAVSVADRQYDPHRALVERSNPHVGKNIIAKRANPTIGDGIDINDPQTGGKLVPRENFPDSGAFANALELLSYANTTLSSENDVVFAKYFDLKDKQCVKDIFLRLLGEDGKGATDLANITVVAVDYDPDDPAPAALEGYDDPHPTLVLSEDIWSVFAKT